MVLQECGWESRAAATAAPPPPPPPPLDVTGLLLPAGAPPTPNTCRPWRSNPPSSAVFSHFHNTQRLIALQVKNFVQKQKLFNSADSQAGFPVSWLLTFCSWSQSAKMGEKHVNVFHLEIFCSFAAAKRTLNRQIEFSPVSRAQHYKQAMSNPTKVDISIW